jgi:hypothetical protein
MLGRARIPPRRSPSPSGARLYARAIKGGSTPRVNTIDGYLGGSGLQHVKRLLPTAFAALSSTAVEACPFKGTNQLSELGPGQQMARGEPHSGKTQPIFQAFLDYLSKAATAWCKVLGLWGAP